MRQFQVPQFLTVEDKVFGPFTIRQFLYIGFGALIIILLRMFLEGYLFFPIAFFIAGLAVALAFLKVNEQPFPVVLKNAFFYFTRPRLFIWRRVFPGTGKGKDVETPAKKASPAAAAPPPKLTGSRLSDLAWSLDVEEKLKQ